MRSEGADLQPAQVLGAQRKVVDAEERPRGVVWVQQQEQLGQLEGRCVQALPAQPLHTPRKLRIMQRYSAGSEARPTGAAAAFSSVSCPMQCLPAQPVHTASS